MDKKYDEVMEHIEVTPEMRQRILKHIQQVDFTKQRPAKGIDCTISVVLHVRFLPSI